MSDEKNPTELEPTGGEVFEDDKPQESTPQEGDGTGKEATEGEAPALKEEPPKGVSAEDIALAIKKAGLGQTPSGKEDKPYTMEDFNRVMNVYNPPAGVVEDILAGGDRAVAALGQIVNGVNKQSVTMASYMIQQLREDLETKFATARQFAQKQYEEDLRKEFLTKYTDLKGFEPLLTEIVGQMKASGFQAETKEEAFKAIAERAKVIIKSLPGLQTGARNNPTAQPGKMPALSGGGQGGVGGGNSVPKKPKGPPGIEVFS
jgi:hypothetical protein